LDYINEELNNYSKQLNNEKKEKTKEKKDKVVDTKIYLVEELDEFVAEIIVELNALKKRYFPQGYSTKNYVDGGATKRHFKKLETYIKKFGKEIMCWILSRLKFVSGKINRW